MPTVMERARELKQKRGELGAIYDAHKKGDGAYDMDAAVLADVRGRNEELNRLTQAWEEAKALEDGAAANDRALADLKSPQRPPFDNGGGDPGGHRKERKSLGQLVMESRAVTEHKRGNRGVASEVDFDVKTLMSTSAGWDPEDTRTGKVLLNPQQQVRVVDLVPKTTTKQSTVLYMEETTFTQGAAEVAEAGTYGEAALVYTERSSEVRKIGVSLPVTDEMLEDTERLAGLIDGRLRFMLMKRLDLQILVGNGTAPNLRGVNNLTGINTQVKGGDPVFDAFYKAIVQCQTVGFEDPDGIVMHPLDWQDVRLTRTQDGIYIMGNPADDVAPRMFGLPVVPTTHQTQNTGIVGCWQMHSELSLRRGVEVRIFDQYGTDALEGKQRLRADLRAALIFDRASAFCTVTGI